jgi:hypothetical protein
MTEEYLPTGIGLDECAAHFTGADASVIGKGIQIISPKDDSVFFYDPSISSKNQAVSVEVTHTAGEELEIRINGKYYDSIGSLPASGSRKTSTWYFPLERGKWDIEIRQKNGPSDSVRIRVR